jgi:Cu(I)/Ag(I) efflux system membrane fusion protein
MNHPRRTFLRMTLISAGALYLNACSKPQGAGLPPGVSYYTCSMHNWVRESAPGKCPVCGMTLIPVMKAGAETMSAGPAAFVVPLDRQQEIGVTYATVVRAPLRRTMHAAGTVDYDRQRDWQYVARTDGYVKELFVTSPGESVAADQPLLSLYSPDLFSAEREYAMLLGTPGAAAQGMLVAARARLKQWNVPDEEIAALEKNRQPASEITLRSPFRGVVREVAAQQGGSVKTGDKLVEVVDLSEVWVWADFYEAEMGAIATGRQAAIAVSAYPGEWFRGTVTVVDPFLDEATRTFKVRIDIANPEQKLRPGMYGDVALDAEMGEGLIIPLNAVMPTGRRNLVFVDKGGGSLEPRDVTLGGEYDGGYEVKAGLAEGERIVSSATFLIDAEAQIQGALEGLDRSSGGVKE